ncbi:MAG: hypothetical protein ACTSRL_19065 [Candidatus Helarchaeota archaeon]
MVSLNWKKDPSGSGGLYLDESEEQEEEAVATKIDTGSFFGM